LTAPPSEVHGRSAMRYIAMDRTPQVQPPPAPADLLAANQPRTHDARKSLGQRMGLRHVGGIGDMAGNGGCQGFKKRRAPPPPPALLYSLSLSRFAALRLLPPAHRTLPRHRVRATASRRPAFRRNARKRTHPTHMETKPMGVENLVEPLPIGMRRAE